MNAGIINVSKSKTIKKTEMKFEYCDVRAVKGGHVEFLREKKDGVYICLGNVHARDGSNVKEHYFVWNAKYYDKKSNRYYPVIIDNQDKVPIQLLQDKDIESKMNLYKALEKIFDGECFIHYILKVTK